jgi:hypothetical protein
MRENTVMTKDQQQLFAAVDAKQWEVVGFIKTPLLHLFYVAVYLAPGPNVTHKYALYTFNTQDGGFHHGLYHAEIATVLGSLGQRAMDVGDFF